MSLQSHGWTVLKVKHIYRAEKRERVKGLVVQAGSCFTATQRRVSQRPACLDVWLADSPVSHCSAIQYILLRLPLPLNKQGSISSHCHREAQVRVEYSHRERCCTHSKEKNNNCYETKRKWFLLKRNDFLPLRLFCTLNNSTGDFGNHFYPTKYAKGSNNINIFINEVCVSVINQNYHLKPT